MFQEKKEVLPEQNHVGMYSDLALVLPYMLLIHEGLCKHFFGKVNMKFLEVFSTGVNLLAMAGYYMLHLSRKILKAVA